MLQLRQVVAASVCFLVAACVGRANAAAPEARVIDSRAVEIVANGEKSVFEIPIFQWKVVENEKYDALPIFNPNANSWMKGRVLRGVNACECAVFGALDPESVKVRLASGGDELERGVDYQFDESSGAIGRLENHRIGENSAVLVSYRCVESRVDSIVANPDGAKTLVQGESRVLSPEPPTLKEGQRRLVNVYTTGRSPLLTNASLFPVDEVFADQLDPLDAKEFVSRVGEYLKARDITAPAVSDVGAAKKFLPKTWKKLTSGEEVRILAWGDSVTACGFLPDDQRWQIKFSQRLQQMFPNAKIVMLTEAWGGRSSDSYRNEPPGSPKNYKEKVLDLKPDLIVSEFVNDAYMDEATVAKRYGEMLNDFRNIGAEWVILGPHYVRPDWMGLASERDVDNDPRPLVKGLRAFAAENEIPFADTPTMYGKLWRAGIPYVTLMTNNINHPNNFGMELFAAALARLFEE